MLRSEPDALFVRGPGMWQGPGKTGDREVGGKSSLDDRSDHSRRDKGLRRKLPDVTLPVGFAYCDLRK